MATAADAAAFDAIRAEDPSCERCFDCGADSADWAAVHHGVLLCLHCAGKHRGLGVHLSFVRSTTMDTWHDWRPEALERFRLGGNARAAVFFADHGVPAADGERRSHKRRYLSDGALMWRDRLDAAAQGREWREADWVRPPELPPAGAADAVTDAGEVYAEGDWCEFAPPGATPQPARVLRVDLSHDTPSYVVELADGSRRGARQQWLRPRTGPPPLQAQLAQWGGDAQRAAIQAAEGAKVARQRMASATVKAGAALAKGWEAVAARGEGVPLEVPELEVNEVAYLDPESGAAVRFTVDTGAIAHCVDGDPGPPGTRVDWDGMSLSLGGVERRFALPVEHADLARVLGGLRHLARSAAVETNIADTVLVARPDPLAGAKAKVGEQAAKAGAALRGGWRSFADAAAAASAGGSATAANRSSSEDSAPAAAAPQGGAAVAGAALGSGWRAVSSAASGIAQSAGLRADGNGQGEAHGAGSPARARAAAAGAKVAAAGQAGWQALRSGWQAVVAEAGGETGGEREAVPVPRRDVDGTQFVTPDTGDTLEFVLGDAALFYRVSGQPRPPFNELRFTPPDMVEFPDIGKRCRLPASGMAELLGDLRCLCERAGVRHDIPGEIHVHPALAARAMEQTQKMKQRLGAAGRTAQDALSRGWRSLFAADTGSEQPLQPQQKEAPPTPPAPTVPAPPPPAAPAPPPPPPPAPARHADPAQPPPDAPATDSPAAPAADGPAAGGDYGED
eukprot:TRINITY_DN20889_c0_g3_i1.p1 TRINITY_DN20889_c0_g3~~TRINITY_DN20889_c0_g3_i1.p1  ORF type:complete len:759 (+),score=236.07 TRINITY_DN20889_c0_g3_i1:69-2279(+)